MSEGDGFLTTVKFFLYYSQIFGFNPVRLEGNRFKVSWLGAAYSLVVTFALWFPLRSVYLDLDILVRYRLGFDFVWKFSIVTFGPICSALILVLSVTSCRTLCDVINKLALYDEKLKKKVAGVRYGLSKHFFLWTSVACHAVCFFYLYSEHQLIFYPLDKNSKPQKLPYPSTVRYLLSSAAWAVFDVVSWPQILNIFYLSYLIHRKFHLINAQIDATLSEYEDLRSTKAWDNICHVIMIRTRRTHWMESHRNIAHIRQLHSLLCNISADLSSVLTPTLLIIIGYNLVQLCFASFLFVAVFLAGFRNYILFISMSWVAARLLPIVVIFIAFSMVANEASRPAVTVHHVLNKRIGHEMKEELWSFAMLLENHKLEFTVLKMFHLRKTTIMYVVGIAASYILVFLQYELAFTKLRQQIAAQMRNTTPATVTAATTGTTQTPQ